MRQPESRAAARRRVIAAAGCAGLLLAGCSGSAAPPTGAQLISSAAAALGGRACAISGAFVPSGSGVLVEDIEAVSAGHRFRGTVTDHYRTTRSFTVTERFIDDGTALYLQSPDTIRLLDTSAPAAAAGRWVRFPSWPNLGTHAAETDFSELTTQPGLGGGVLENLTTISTAAPGKVSCAGLLAQMRSGQPDSVAAGRLDGRPVFAFTLHRLFSALAPDYRITVTGGAPARVLQVTSGSYVLSLRYPAGIAPISAPPAANVVPADQLPALLKGGR
jgi:hypothetical protein